MTIKQQGGIFGRNPTFNDVDATDITSSTITATTSVSTPVETISGNTSSVSFASNSAGMFFSGGADATKYSGIVFKGANSWNTFLGRIPDGAADPLVIGNDAISAFGAMCTFGYNDVTINRGNLVIGTSGQGIDFSATSGTGTSELFDDYEEGTWTPTYFATGTDFTSVTYDAQEGYYTKIGDTVIAHCNIRTDALSGGSGNVRITGLPFSALNARNSFSIYQGSFGGNAPNSGFASGSQLFLAFQTASDGAATLLDASDMGTGTNANKAMFSAVYKTSS